MRNRKIDQRRYDYEKITGHKPGVWERSLLTRYTAKEVASLVKLRDELTAGRIPDFSRLFEGGESGD